MLLATAVAVSACAGVSPGASAVLPSFRSGGGFPIAAISVPSGTIAEVNETAAGPARDHAATAKLLLPAMQQLFARPGWNITVDPKDITMKQTFPDTQVDSDCHHKIEAEHPTGEVSTQKGTELQWGVDNVSWHGATVFADGRLVSILDVSTDVCVRVGESIFHHCEELAKKTVGIDIKSDGDVGIGINITASNAHIAFVNKTLSLIFDIHASVVGTVLKWNVDKVTADNCKIKILGIEIFSVCGLVEKYVKEGASKLTNEVMTVTAPKLLTKLQNKLNTALGSKVVIPLKVSN